MTQTDLQFEQGPIRPPNEAQSLLLRTAARNPDGRVIPPDTLRGGARVKVLTSLLQRGWIEPADRGHVLTDAEGRFVLAPSLRPPFELLVVLPGGRYARPVRFDTADVQPLVVAVEWQIEESVTVTAGSAPGLEGPPASGMTLVTAADVSSRAPSNLAQALENVAGASTQSEGQAAVPALRGLAGGRTLVLLDGARVTTERRAGPSATYADPSVFEAVEVARGPGSVAYGSDAFGGVILMRTRRAEPGSPFGGRFDGALGAGAPQQRAALALTKGFSRGGLLVAGHLRELEDWESPRGTVPNSSASDWKNSSARCGRPQRCHCLAAVNTCCLKGPVSGTPPGAPRLSTLIRKRYPQARENNHSSAWGLASTASKASCCC